MLKRSLQDVINLLSQLGSHNAVRNFFYGDDLAFAQKADDLKPPMAWGRVLENIRILNTDQKPKRGQKKGITFYKSYDARLSVLCITETDNPQAQTDIEVFADHITDQMIYIFVNEPEKIPAGLAVTFEGKTIVAHNFTSIGMSGVELQMSVVHPIQCDDSESSTFLDNINDLCNVVASFTYIADGTEAVLTNASSNYSGTPQFLWRYHRSETFTEVNAQTLTIPLPTSDLQYIEVTMKVEGGSCNATTRAAIFTPNGSVVGKSFGNELKAYGDFDSRDFHSRDFYTE